MSAVSDFKRTPILGCIADDVTGATDLAINLVQGGMCVVQLLEIPSADALAQIDADAVVVGLKTRSIPKADAIAQSLATLDAFRKAGFERFFFKYCSTFDSTLDGNIGPVAVALLEELGANQTVFCPAFPRNGRTVYQGHLFVFDKLLSESGMEKHPLNPMTDANLVRFLGQQAGRQVGLVSTLELDDAEPVKTKLADLQANDIDLVITDACSDTHLRTLASAVRDMPLVTGGSGIGRFLPEAYRESGLLASQTYVPTSPAIRGRSLIVAGSCSTATNQQVEWMADKVPTWRIDVDAIVSNRDAEAARVIDWAKAAEPSRPILLSSTARPDVVASIQEKHGATLAAQAIESFLSDVTAQLVSELGITRLIVAGGETSGAIVNKLGVTALKIGTEICAGVPWTESLGEPRLALALKSGNFGTEDFFERALEMLP